MHKVNELFGKRVIDKHSGDQIAIVRDVVLDTETGRIVALVIGDGAWGSKDRVVTWGEVIGAGEFVVVDGSRPFPTLGEVAEVRELRERAERVTGKRVISATGEQIGSVDDIYYDRSGVILGYELKRGLFSGHSVLRAVDVQTVGKDAIIAGSADLVSREALAAPVAEPPPGLAEPSLKDRTAGAPLMEVQDRAAIDPALGEPAAPEGDGRRDM